uniref:G-protein coupled receptors family 1 profile domain-containing protein n=1 Tax=Biomphalaria glabrata TaxID=6526 RepID=A0A2C9L001_BIOGL
MKSYLLPNTTENVLSLDELSSDPVSGALLRFVTFVNYAILIGAISFVGVILNLLNIAVFFKQGFKDTINIPFLGLAVADVCGLISLIWMSICYNPLMVGALPAFSFIDIQHITAGWPHVCFTRISGWLTAFITFERYLCIAVPLKVKRILTRKRTIIAVVFIFLIVIVSVVPVYVAIYIAPRLEEDGALVFGIKYIPDGANLENFSIYFSTFLQLSSFAFVIVCTSGLVYKLNKKSKWRQATSSAGQNEAVSNRDKKVVKMVISMAVVFIVSFTPVVIHMVAMLSKHDYMVGGRYQNLFLLCGTFVFNLEAINCSSSLCIYLKMSSQFKAVFLSLFGFKDGSKTKIQRHQSIKLPSGGETL